MCADNKHDAAVKRRLGRLERSEREAIAAQITESESLRGLIKLVAELHEQDDSGQWPALRAGAHMLLTEQLRSLTRMAAVKTFDSDLLPLPEGVRPAAVDTRRLKYQIDGILIELSLYPVSLDSYEVIGQVCGLDSEAEVSVVLQSVRRKFRTEANQFHLFRFERVPAGNLTLMISVGREEVAAVTIET
jgi:hypothetical protein